MNKYRVKGILVFVFALFVSPSVFSMKIKSLVPFEGFEWALETTAGFQYIEKSVSDGKENFARQFLSSKGILFDSFYNDILLTSVQLNLGFTQRVDFFWTDQPDFAHEFILSNELRSVRLDALELFPVLLNRKYLLSMFASYSYFDAAIEQDYLSEKTEKFMYNSFSGGIQGEFIFNKTFSQTVYASYSPIVFYGTELSNIQFFNLGAELRAKTSPLSFAVSYNVKHAFIQRGRTWLSGLEKNMNSFEFGFIMYWNFKKKSPPVL